MKSRSSSPEKSDKNTSHKHVFRAALQQARVRQGLTQGQLAEMVGIHRNSVQNLERGITQRVAPALAAALAKALEATIEELGLRVRPPAPVSIRLRQLTPEHRAIMEDLLTLTPADLEFVGRTIESLRQRNARQPEPTPRGRRR